MVFSRDCVDKQKLFLQEKLNKACTKDAELRAKELVIMEKISSLHEEYHAFFSCELRLHK